MPRKTKRHTVEQIIGILRESETCGKPIQEFVREKGVSEQTFYRWRSKYGGMDVKDSRRLKELEQENLRLKKIVAEGPRDRGDEGDRCKKMVSARARREQVDHARKRGLSCRGACALLSVARSTLDYQHRMPAKDQPLAEELGALAHRCPRRGYRMARNKLSKRVSYSRVYRVWRNNGLCLPRRRPRCARRCSRGSG